MTAVKHPFECLDASRFRRFKTDTLLEASSIKVTPFCRAAVNPPPHPHPHLPQSQRPYTLPAHSRWFNFKQIHNIERAEFKELEDPEFAIKYKKIRNRFVKIFRLYPTFDVTPSTVRHLYGGDFNLICRIHKFLSTWGLINFTSTASYHAVAYPPDVRAVNEYSQIYFGQGELNKPLNILNPRSPEPSCSLCKQPCGTGHFCSRKYPGVIICPRCFSHPTSLDQLDAQHGSFTFRVLPKQKNQTSKVNMNEYDLYDQYEATQGDWTKICEICTKKQPNISPTQVGYSPMEYLLTMIRHVFSDSVAINQVTSHEFHDEDPVLELISAAEKEQEPLPEPTIEYRDDWEGLEGEINLLEEDVKYTLNSINKSYIS